MYALQRSGHMLSLHAFLTPTTPRQQPWTNHQTTHQTEWQTVWWEGAVRGTSGDNGGLETWHVLSPRYVFFVLFLILLTKIYLQVCYVYTNTNTQCLHPQTTTHVHYHRLMPLFRIPSRSVWENALLEWAHRRRVHYLRFTGLHYFQHHSHRPRVQICVVLCLRRIYVSNQLQSLPRYHIFTCWINSKPPLYVPPSSPTMAILLGTLKPASSSPTISGDLGPSFVHPSWALKQVWFWLIHAGPWQPTKATANAGHPFDSQHRPAQPTLAHDSQ